MSEEALRQYKEAKYAHDIHRLQTAGPCEILGLLCPEALKKTGYFDDKFGQAVCDRAIELNQAWYDEGAEHGK